MEYYGSTTSNRTHRHPSRPGQEVVPRPNYVRSRHPESRRLMAKLCVGV